MLPELWPLPQFEATQPGNTLRVFERGDDRLSNRGFGTLTRTDPVFQGLQRTRLLDPLLYFLGTNDQPGDYRSCGCTACHVVYANDRDPRALGLVREVRPPRDERHRRSDDSRRTKRAIRSSTTSRARSRPASA